MTRPISITLLLVIAVALSACSGPATGPWHTARLSEEFTAGKADDVTTLDDYLALEDRLFAELDEDVYGEVATGPEYALVRYSRGSPADPSGRVPDWNRSIELPVDDPVGGVLLLHGLTDAPYTFKALGEALHERGYWVLALRMPGHGTAPAGIADVHWHDWRAAVDLGMRHLADKVGGRPVHVAGYSTGAPLAVDYGIRAMEGQVDPVPASLVLVSPAIGLHPAAGLSQVKAALSVIPGMGSMEWLQILPEFDPYKYNSFPTNAAVQVYRLTRSTSMRLAARANTDVDPVLPPILVLKSAADATVSTGAVVDNLLARLAPHRHEIVIFDINRYAARALLLVEDPGPLTARVMDADDLPFSATLVTNESPESRAVVAQSKEPFSRDPTRTERLGVDWPNGLISLSHLALPVPPDDPLYGATPPEDDSVLFLGNMALQGERGLLKLPADWMIRLRHNPFYDYLEARTLDWIDAAQAPGDLAPPTTR